MGTVTPLPFATKAIPQQTGFERPELMRILDLYGRMVAACDLAGNDLGRWMVSNGWALAYRRYGRDYIKPEVEAANAARGIHASYFVAPWEFRRDSVDRLQVRPRTSGPRRTQ